MPFFLQKTDNTLPDIATSVHLGSGVMACVSSPYTWVLLQYIFKTKIINNLYIYIYFPVTSNGTNKNKQEQGNNSAYRYTCIIIIIIRALKNLHNACIIILIILFLFCFFSIVTLRRFYPKRQRDGSYKLSPTTNGIALHGPEVMNLHKIMKEFCDPELGLSMDQLNVETYLSCEELHK